MSKLCDLHVHSNYSDGTCTPAELIRLAERQHLGAIALCDHNTIAGLPDFLTAAQGSSVRAVPGIEFSTGYQGTELHIIGLFIQPQHYGQINQLTAIYQKKKEESNQALAKALNDAGYPIDYETVKARTIGIPNRAHFAAELIEKGYLSSIREGCLTILSPKNGLYTPPPRPDAFETISLIKSIGAAAVLAHPFLNLTEADLRTFLQKAAAYGLDGMETVYSEFTDKQTVVLKEIARQYAIKESGGSDFHGYRKKDISLAVGKGNLQIPYEFYLNLKP